MKTLVLIKAIYVVYQFLLLAYVERHDWESKMKSWMKEVLGVENEIKRM